MDNINEKLTRLHLKAFGLSNYTIGKIFKGLNAVEKHGTLKMYTECDVITSVQKMLENSKIKTNNRTKLQRVLASLTGETNVIPVDFLKDLSNEDRLKVLSGRIPELEAKEKNIRQQTSQLLAQAERMATSK
jgi:hypothetical protein